MGVSGGLRSLIVMLPGDLFICFHNSSCRVSYCLFFIDNENLLFVLSIYILRPSVSTTILSIWKVIKSLTCRAIMDGIINTSDS